VSPIEEKQVPNRPARRKKGQRARKPVIAVEPSPGRMALNLNEIAKRPEWDEMIRSLRSGDTLVVTELSRLGRNTGELAALADDLSERNVALRILNLGIDTATVGGRLVYEIIAAVAASERALLVERTHSGLAAARARGRSGGRKREFSPAAVRRAQDQYDARELSIAEIARQAGVSRQTLYRYLDTTSNRTTSELVTARSA
jgi:DNA invertase Pin-like site-specific DNA recombinase